MKYLTTLSCSVLVIAILTFVLPNTEESELYDGFIRLHVVANSDIKKDQTLKHDVRDGILEIMSNLTAECANVKEAETVFNMHRGEITEAASKIIEAKGFDYKVTVTLDDEYYPTCEYAGITLPAGIYRSARILIGNAQGKNWWCILFPPLCVDTAKAKEKLVSAGFSQNQIRILTDGDNVKYKMKFRVLEILEQFFAALGDK